MNKKVILLILDGWGIAKNPAVSAVDQANTPFIDSLYLIVNADTNDPAEILGLNWLCIQMMN